MIIKRSKKILALFSAIRLIPHIILFNIHNKRSIIKYEVNRWLEIKNIMINTQLGFIYLMTYYPEFRNLFYVRIGFVSNLIKWLCPRMNILFIRMRSDQIGKGLFIQNGYATGINAKSIGKDCWINQRVTIGYTNDDDCPTIGNNVTINVGAVVLGKVYMGDNSCIGANTVIVKNVPENCTVVGVPAYIIKKNGIKVKEKL